MKNVTYSIVRNVTNKVVYITDNYDNYIEFVMKHFPKTSYDYNSELHSIILKSKNYTFSMIVMNKDYSIE